MANKPKKSIYEKIELTETNVKIGLITDPYQQMSNVKEYNCSESIYFNRNFIYINTVDCCPVLKFYKNKEHLILDVGDIAILLINKTWYWLNNETKNDSITKELYLTKNLDIIVKSIQELKKTEYKFGALFFSDDYEKICLPKYKINN